MMNQKKREGPDYKTKGVLNTRSGGDPQFAVISWEHNYVGPFIHLVIWAVWVTLFHDSRLQC